MGFFSTFVFSLPQQFLMSSMPLLRCTGSGPEACSSAAEDSWVSHGFANVTHAALIEERWRKLAAIHTTRNASCASSSTSRDALAALSSQGDLWDASFRRGLVAHEAARFASCAAPYVAASTSAALGWTRVASFFFGQACPRSHDDV